MSNISDTTIEIDGNNIISVSENYKNQINAMNLDTIDLNTFSVLKDFGIGVDYFTQLGASLKSIKENSIELVDTLIAMIKQHEGIDNQNAGGYTGGGLDGGTGGGNGGSTIPDSTVIEPSNEINEKFNESINKLSFENTKSLFLSLLSEANNITELLYLESKADLLQKMILDDANIPKEIKKMALQMNTKELQKAMLEYLKNVKSENKFVEIINKNINVQVKTIVLSKLLKDYNTIADDKNIQERLLKIYDGNDTSINVETFDLTKVVLENMAKEKDVSVEKLLTDNLYSEFVSIEIAALHEAIIFNGIKEKVSK